MTDRGFFSIEPLDVLDSMGLTYLILYKNTANIIGELREFAENKHGKTSDIKLTAGIGKSVKYIMKIVKRKKQEIFVGKHIRFVTNDDTVNV